MLDGTVADISHDSGQEGQAVGPALVIAPAGETTIRIRRAGFIVRVISARNDVVMTAVNAETYATADPAIAPIPSAPYFVGPETLRFISVEHVPEIAGRLGRIYQTDSLMINWFAPQDGPRNTDELSPHHHDDFEQVSLTLGGDFIHHIRVPWTKRLRDWRPDEHIQVASPSVTVIPPRNIHTTRAVGSGSHLLVDVFAPPRTDFLSKGWVLNQADYRSTAR
ncbi:hypothetical protein [Subtercola sp. YIM 133946]|uniref:hypothetical protein n=1 Tax=Subtercola sp. YIM 133946 TaxID=3118909 RepID=UPI002F933CE0